MARVTVERALERTPNHFALTRLAALRAKQLRSGVRPTVNCSNGVAVTALREIEAGHVRCHPPVTEALAEYAAEVERTGSELREDKFLPSPRGGQQNSLPSVSSDSAERVSIHRHPRISIPRPLYSSQPMTFLVELMLLQAIGARRISFSGIDPDWSELPVDVQVVARGAIVPNPRGRMRVLRAANSEPCEFRGTVNSDATEVSLTAHFYLDARPCGSVSAEFRVTSSESSLKLSPSTSDDISSFQSSGTELGSSSISFRPDASSPDLTIRISKVPNSPNILHWTLVPSQALRRARGLPEKLDDYCTFDPTRVAESVCVLEKLLQENDPKEFVAYVNAVGERLYNLTPQFFRDAYDALTRSCGSNFSIQFVCDDVGLPWEWIRPRGRKPLLLQHPVARWLREYDGKLQEEILPGRILVTGTRRTPGELPTPVEVIATLSEFEQEVSAKSFDATIEKFLDVLQNLSEPISLLYVVAHATVHGSLLDFDTLHLEDGNLDAFRIDTEETKLGEECGTFVFLNSCGLGRSKHGDGGKSTGWPATLIKRGFRGVLAPMSPVWDSGGAAMARHFLRKALVERQPIAQALCEFRTRDHVGLTYLFYGDVMARFT